MTVWMSLVKLPCSLSARHRVEHVARSRPPCGPGTPSLSIHGSNIRTPQIGFMSVQRLCVITSADQRSPSDGGAPGGKLPPHTRANPTLYWQQTPRHPRIRLTSISSTRTFCFCAVRLMSDVLADRRTFIYTYTSWQDVSRWRRADFS